MKRFWTAATLTLFIHSFSVWVYIAGNAVFHPETLPLPLTHLFSFPREDTTGVVCFFVSFVSFFAWTYMRSFGSTSPHL